MKGLYVLFAIATFAIFIPFALPVADVKTIDHELRLRYLQSDDAVTQLSDTSPKMKDDERKFYPLFFKK
jgi:hypothetical protein